MWLLLPVSAFAQEEACDPVPVATLDAHLDAAEAAVARGDTAAARAEATTAEEDARCLAVPVPRPTLGRLAWVRAELSASDLDEEIVWQWVRLARAVGATEPPARLPADAPLREVLAGPEAPVSSGGPTGVVLSHPSRGTVWADGQPLTEPKLLLSTPHLVQVFSEKARVSGAWQMGGSFPSYLLTHEAAGVARTRDDRGHTFPPDDWKPRKAGTEAAYVDWIQKHPNGPWLEDAQDGIDDLHWAAAVLAGTELAAKQYLHDHPTGLHVADAKFALEDRAYRRVMADPSRTAWEALLRESPEGMYASEARVQLDALDWKDARTKDTAAAYRKYLDLQPEGRNRQRAEELELERAFDLARAKDDDALQAFLERWPGSVWTDEARAILGDAKFTDVAVTVDGDGDAGVKAAIEKQVLAELARRKLPVTTTPSATTARLRVTATIEQKPGIADLGADVRLEWGALDRPLLQQRVSSTMLPKDDAGAILGAAVVANLLPLDRWRAP